MSDVAKSNASSTTVTAKIGFLVGALVVAIALLSIVSFRGIHNLSGELNQVANVSSHKVELAASLAEELSMLSAVRRGTVLQTMLSDSAGAAQYKRQWKESEQKVAAMMDEIRKIASTDTERQQVRHVSESLQRLSTISQQMAQALDNQQMDVALKLQTEALNPAQEAVRSTMAKFADSQRSGLKLAADNAESSASLNRWIIIGFVALSVTGGILSLMFFTPARPGRQ